jgi:membrane-bound serine protease (ClpP class)
VILGAILLLIAALAFVAAELFLPSHGVLAVVAAAAAVGSIVLAFMANAALGMLFAVVIFAATPFVIYLAVKLYPRTAMGRRVMLDAPAAGAAADAFAAEAARRAALVGHRGVAVTLLRPAGSIEIAGRRIDALSEADVIEPGTAVEVLRTAGLKVFVKPIPQETDFGTDRAPDSP